MLALTTQAHINLTLEEKTRKGRSISSIGKIHPTVPTRTILPVPGSDYGETFTFECKSLCLWPRKDGTCNGQLNGAYAFASGRMNPEFIDDVLRNLGPDNSVTFRGIENNYRALAKKIKITNGVKVSPDLPELKIVEENPAEQQNQPEMFDLIPVEEDFQPAADFKSADSLLTTTEVTEEALPAFIADYFKPEPMPLKRKLPMPTSSPKRHQPCQPQVDSSAVANASSAPTSGPRFQVSQLLMPLAGVPADGKTLERHQPEVPELFSDWLE